MQTFKLMPYQANDSPKIDITGQIERMENRLSIRYVVTGEIDFTLLPKLAEFPVRKDELWRTTCFEFFIAIKDQPQYWEFNMSPSGNWNVYAMDTYRQVNMREELAFMQLPFEFQKTNKEIFLDISLNLNPILQPEDILEIGITTIVQTTDGNETYWALAHPGQHADFHLRESFLIEH